MKDVAIFIGRFSPLHNGHLSVIYKAFAVAKKLVIIVGSSGGPRTLRNPFLFEERRDMIMSSIPETFKSNIAIVPLEDSLYNDELWTKNVQAAVAHAYEQLYGPWSPLALTKANATLIGHQKDHTSFYLKMFPQWDSTAIDNYENLSSTDIRNALFSLQAEDIKELSQDIHYPFVKTSAGTFLTGDWVFSKPVHEAIFNIFVKTKEYKKLVEEYNFINKYKKQWENSPYAPTFVTVDSVVVQSGHILLVRRKSEPGKNLWALPGGFIASHEKIVDAMLRELKEETKIKVPIAVLRGSIVKKCVFDDPNRSMRGRTITHAFLIVLPPSKELPQIKGSDDAEEAKWVPLAKVKMSDMFEDHMSIINSMVCE